jgi:uncharacterized protein
MTYEKLITRWQQNKKLNTDRADTIKSRLKNECVDLYNRYGVNKVIIFGSLLTPNFNKHSDVDVLVLPLENEKYWEFQHQLEHLLNVDIDLHTNSDDPSFVSKIISRGEVIYEA